MSKGGRGGGFHGARALVGFKKWTDDIVHTWSHITWTTQQHRESRVAKQVCIVFSLICTWSVNMVDLSRGENSKLVFSSLTLHYLYYSEVNGCHTKQCLYIFHTHLFIYMHTFLLQQHPVAGLSWSCLSV